MRRGDVAYRVAPIWPSLLAQCMDELGVTQRELMRRTDLPNQTISAAYHGRPGTIETYLKIAEALDVPLAQIQPDHAALVRRVRID